MIIKQLKNRCFRTTDEYVVNKEKAKIIYANMLGDTPRVRAREVAACRRYRPKLQRACGHVVFSLPHREDENGNVTYHENLTDDQAIELVTKWREGMGVTSCMYFLARHQDKEHDHFHLVFCRIRFDGSVIDDGWDYYRSQPIVRKLEKEFGLEVQLNSWDVGHRAQTKKQKHHSSGELPVTKKLEQLINAATADKPTVTEMIDRLQQQGVIVRPTFSTKGLFKNAIAFELDGVAIAGNKLGKAYSFPGLQKQLGVDYDPERDMPALKATLVDPQQAALAAAIYPIAKFVFELELNNGELNEITPHREITPHFSTFTGEYYKLIRDKQRQASIVAALDGRGELLRYSNGKLESAQNLTQEDVTRWESVERLYKRKEAEAKSLQQETKPQPIEASGTQQQVERNRQEAERQRLETERKRQEAERQQLEAERQRQKTERERQRLEAERQQKEKRRSAGRDIGD